MSLEFFSIVRILQLLQKTPMTLEYFKNLKKLQLFLNIFYYQHTSVTLKDFIIFHNCLVSLEVFKMLDRL